MNHHEDVLISPSRRRRQQQQQQQPKTKKKKQQSQHADDCKCHRGRCHRRMVEKIMEQRQVILELKAQLVLQGGPVIEERSQSPHAHTFSSCPSVALSPKTKTQPSDEPQKLLALPSSSLQKKSTLSSNLSQNMTKRKTKQLESSPLKLHRASHRRKKMALASPSKLLSKPMVAPLYLLQDGIKPFKCMVGCGRAFSNYFQLAFHAKQHPGNDPRDVVGDQLPFPVGPKYCPVPGCEFSEQNGKCMKTLQIVKRHWQRVHQNDRPFLCPDCPPQAQKAFKTRDNLTAHRKECKKKVQPETTIRYNNACIA